MTEIITNPGRQRGEFSVIFHKQDEEQVEMFGSEIEEEEENNESLPANDGEITKDQMFGSDEQFEKDLAKLMGMNCSLFPTHDRV